MEKKQIAARDEKISRSEKAQVKAHYKQVKRIILEKLKAEEKARQDYIIKQKETQWVSYIKLRV